MSLLNETLEAVSISTYFSVISRISCFEKTRRLGWCKFSVKEKTKTFIILPLIESWGQSGQTALSLTIIGSCIAQCESGFDPVHHTHMHRHTHTCIHKHTHTHTRMHTHTHTCPNIHSHTHRYTHMQTHTIFLSLSLYRPDMTFAVDCELKNNDLYLSLTHTHTQTHARTHANTHTCKHTHTLFL